MKTIQKITLGLCLLLMGDFSFKAGTVTTISKKIEDVKFDATSVDNKTKFVTMLNAMNDLSKISFIPFSDLDVLKDLGKFTELTIFNPSQDELKDANVAKAFNDFFTKSSGDGTTVTSITAKTTIVNLAKEAASHIPSKVFKVDVSAFITDAAKLQTALNILMEYNNMITGTKFIVFADKAVEDVLDNQKKALDITKVLKNSTELTEAGIAFINYLNEKFKITAKFQATNKTNFNEMGKSLQPIFTAVQALDIAKGIEAAAGDQDANAGKDGKAVKSGEEANSGDANTTDKKLSMMETVKESFKLSDKVSKGTKVVVIGGTVFVFGLSIFGIVKLFGGSSEQPIQENNGDEDQEARSAAAAA